MSFIGDTLARASSNENRDMDMVSQRAWSVIVRCTKISSMSRILVPTDL